MAAPTSPIPLDVEDDLEFDLGFAGAGSGQAEHLDVGSGGGVVEHAFVDVTDLLDVQ